MVIDQTSESSVSALTERKKTARVFEKKQSLAIDIGGAAIFGALSIVVSIFTTENLPRMDWGIAYFDPVSVIWLLSFLLFGYRAGILTCFIGMIGLMPFDPTPFVGPVMKFVATIWFVLIPYTYAKLVTNKKPDTKTYKNLRIYLPGILIALIVRSIVMIFLDYLYIKYVWQVPVEFFNMGWIGHAEIGGWTAVIFTVALLNTIQSLSDGILPYIIIYPTKIYEKVLIK